MEKKIVYHETPGPENTDLTLSLAVEAALEQGIGTMVVASRTGDTAVKLMERLRETEIRLVVITPQYGFREEHRFDRELIPRIREAGHEFYAGMMPFHAGELYGCSVPSRMGDLLRTFSQGVQVCVQIAMMAFDGGLVHDKEPCVFIAGTWEGADTALVATPASSASMEDLRVHEVLCKPHLRG